MHAPVPSRSRRSAFRRFAALVAVSGALAACDRHSAQEAPEGYGHGSAHADAAGRESYSDHRIDSGGPEHFSDTRGTESEKAAEAAATATPSPAAAGTPAGHFF